MELRVPESLSAIDEVAAESATDAAPLVSLSSTEAALLSYADESATLLSAMLLPATLDALLDEALVSVRPSSESSIDSVPMDDADDDDAA